MKKRDILIKSEDGSVLVVALVMLVLLTLLGISATTTSSIEMRISGNERTYKDNLYRAEAAAMAGAQMLENETNVDVLKLVTPLDPDWLKGSLPDAYIRSDTNWDPSNNNSDESIDSSGRYLAVDNGIAPGSSLDIGASSTLLHEFGVFGRSANRGGEVIIEIGYRKRF